MFTMASGDASSTIFLMALVGAGVFASILLTKLGYVKVTCAWCRTKVFKRDAVLGQYDADYRSKGRKKGRAETWWFCNLKCRTDYEAAHGVKEIRHRIIEEEEK